VPTFALSRHSLFWLENLAPTAFGKRATEIRVFLMEMMQLFLMEMMQLSLILRALI